MSEGIEVIIKTAKAVREAHDYSGTAPKVASNKVKKTAPIRLKSLLSDWGTGAIIPLAVLTVWQLAGSAGLISPQFLPAPLSILSAFAALTASGELTHHLGVSIGRAGTGFVIGGIFGLLFGVLTGLFRKAEYLLDPSIQVLRLVPHLAIAPLIILWFGFGEVSKVAIILSGSFFPLYINTFMGIRGVDNKLFEVARVLGFSPLQKLRRLILPAALPSMLLGLRLSMAVAWIGLVVAELIGSQSGVGFLINEAKQNSNTEVIFVGIIIFAVVGKLIDSLFRIIERKLLHWRDSYQG
ncbi:Putative aliphatic sulfonates transport permease protein SsuC [Paenibacillus auburnensis]|uniref:Aliphatic sulfonates transport permease protein SsuC n=1 Tax=Paenibacillus auburnensis TaxID=2905649 RepID=A0ABN8H3C5_9BACL|nr:ABC transporter permease [Paenibacillus auburnensis]CAH1221936.1 Putative aliphatic sulfonates transport permease protein SsuC [Paenibacillus auburnensis]